MERKLEMLNMSATKNMDRTESKGRVQNSVETLKLNMLEYKNEPELTPIVMRNRRKLPFQQSSYTEGSTMMIDLQTGNFYIDPHNSYLVFDLTLNLSSVATTANTFQFGIGSAFNIFNDVVVTSRSGTEISRIHKLNLYRSKVDHYTKSENWFNTVGKVCGYDSTDPVVFNVADTKTAATETVRFCLPLSMVSPFFNLKDNASLPPYITSGLRIELSLSNSLTAFIRTGTGGTPSFTVSSPAVMLDMFKMRDSLEKVQTARANSSGLQLLWDEVDSFSSVLTSGSSNTIEIRKSASRAKNAFGVSRLVSNIVENDDALASEPFAYTSFQSRYGSLYEPQSSLTNSTELYLNSLYLFKGENKSGEINVDSAKFEGDYGVVGVDLNRSNVYKNATVPTNNSHTLSFDVSFDSDANRQFDVFFSFKKLLVVYTNNSIAKE